jgi:hypothetical protein
MLSHLRCRAGAFVPNFEPRLAILPPSQLALLPRLRPAQDLGLVLYGGTVVALRCGNRVSVDFGFFGPRCLDKNSLRQTRSLVQEGMVLQDEIDTLSVMISGVKLSFFGEEFTALAPQNPRMTSSFRCIAD